MHGMDEEKDNSRIFLDQSQEANHLHDLYHSSHPFSRLIQNHTPSPLPYSLGRSPKPTLAPYSNTLLSQNLSSKPSKGRPHFPPPLNLYSNLPQGRSKHSIAALSTEDEALIQRFLNLKTEDEQRTILQVPQHAAKCTDWGKCLLTRVITQRTVIDSSFSSWMIKTWRADPATAFTPISKACYLVEFATKEEMLRVQTAGPWTFRGDIMATRQVSSQKDLSIDHIKFVDMWVQLYNIPVNSVNLDGLEILGQQLGTPMSLSVEGFSWGRRFVRMKVKMEADKVVNDMVVFRHPTLGDFEVHCHYERASHICRFCGLLGHEMVACADHIGLMRIASTSDHGDRINRSELMEPRKGAWITDSSLVLMEQGVSRGA